MVWRYVAIVVALLATLAACSDDPPRAATEPFDCRENTPGTGDLEVDIVGRWMFIQNASQQFFTFDDNGTAVRTWTSDEHDDVSYTTHDYSIDRNFLAIRDYAAYELTHADGLWTVEDREGSAGWIRCRPLSS